MKRKNNRLTPASDSQGRWADGPRQYGIVLLILGLTLLNACEFGTGQAPKWLTQFEKPKETAKATAAPHISVRGDDTFFGVVVADEPLAALAARSVLAGGGTAADAAVVLYFSLAVTYPSAASLGGGGVCVVHDWENEQVSVLDFLQPLPSLRDSQAGLVPGNVGGLAALHLRFRGKSWADLIAPAEEYAKNGIRISKVLAQDLEEQSARLLTNMETRHLLANHEGIISGEGDRLYQFELASTLKYIRTLGPSAFYRGVLAKKLTSASATRGGLIDHSQLGDFRAEWRPPLSVSHGEETLYTAGSTGGRIVVRMWEMLTKGNRYKLTSAEERPHLLAEISMRSFAGANSRDTRENWMDDFDPKKHLPVGRLPFTPTTFPDNRATTSYAIVDRKGLAVACSHTMNRSFGTAAIVPGMGVFFAAPTETSHDAVLAPVLVMRDVGKTRLPEDGGQDWQLKTLNLKTDPLDYGAESTPSYIHTEPVFLAAPSGGVDSISALVGVAAEVLLGGQRLSDALAAPRVHHSGIPDVVTVEKNIGSVQVGSLLEREQRVVVIEALGHVNAISCAKGVRLGPENCEVKNEPRGFGFGLRTKE